MMKITRVYGDPAGETRLMEVEIEDGFTSPIPAVALRIGMSRPVNLAFHPAPKRGLVTAMRGEYEIVTTSGERKRFRQGEWLLADDVGTKGHTSESFGEDAEMLHCELPGDWTGWRICD